MAGRPIPDDPLPTMHDGERWTLTFTRTADVIHLSGPIDRGGVPLFAAVLWTCDRDTTVNALDLTAVASFSPSAANCFVERGWHQRPHPTVIASPDVRLVLEDRGLTGLLDRHGWCSCDGPGRCVYHGEGRHRPRATAPRPSTTERRPGSCKRIRGGPRESS